MIKRLTILAILCAAGLTAAAQPERNRPPVWKTAVASERDHELRRSYETSTGPVWMLVGSKPQEQLPTNETRTELIGLDANGEELARIDLDTLFSGKDVIRFEDLAVLADGNVAIFVTSSANALFAYTVVPAQNRIASAMSLGGPRVAHFVSDVVPAEDGRFLVVGRADARGWLMKLEASLAIRWDRTFEDEPLTVFHDAAVLPDGSIVAVGAQLLETSQTNLWVGELSTEGQVAARKVFAGREASIAVAPHGLAVVYDVKSATGWDVFLRGYVPGLDEEWTTPILTNLRMPREYRIAAGTRGEWVVAGPKENRLWVGTYGSNGEPLSGWSAPLENELWERLWNVGDLMVRGSNLLFPYTLHTLDEEKRQVKRVRVTKLSLRAMRQEKE